MKLDVNIEVRLDNQPGTPAAVKVESKAYGDDWDSSDLNEAMDRLLAELQAQVLEVANRCAGELALRLGLGWQVREASTARQLVRDLTEEDRERRSRREEEQPSDG